MPEPSAKDLHALLSAYQDADAATVAGALLSPGETPHLLIPRTGTAVHTWCALDGLLVARLLDCDVRLVTRPPHPTGHPPLEVTIRGGALHAGPGHVLSFPHVAAADGSHFTEAFCPYANVFPTLADYETWAVTSPRPTTPLSLPQADEIARHYAADVRAHHRTAPHRRPVPPPARSCTISNSSRARCTATPANTPQPMPGPRRDLAASARHSATEARRHR